MHNHKFHNSYKDSVKHVKLAPFLQRVKIPQVNYLQHQSIFVVSGCSNDDKKSDRHHSGKRSKSASSNEDTEYR